MVTPPACVNEEMAVPSIKFPLQNIVKLAADVSGSPRGAPNHPLAKVIVVEFTYVPVFCIFVFKWQSIGFDGMIADPKSSNVTLKPLTNGVDIPEGAEIFCVPVEDGWGL